jgi:hypothetical protein
VNPALSSSHCTTIFTVVEWVRLPETPLNVIVYVPAVVFFVPCWPLLVARLKNDEADEAPGVTDAGENVQVAPAGRPLQLRATALLNAPPKADTEAV